MLKLTMNTKATPHKWLLIGYFVSKNTTIIVKFLSINFLLSHLKYLIYSTCGQSAQDCNKSMKLLFQLRGIISLQIKYCLIKVILIFDL